MQNIQQVGLWPVCVFGLKAYQFIKMIVYLLRGSCNSQFRGVFFGLCIGCLDSFILSLFEGQIYLLTQSNLNCKFHIVRRCWFAIMITFYYYVCTSHFNHNRICFSDIYISSHSNTNLHIFNLALNNKILRFDILVDLKTQVFKCPFIDS